MANETKPATATVARIGNTVVTLNYRRQHPGGGSLGRASYGMAGVPGILVVDVAMFDAGTLQGNGGKPPATLTVDFTGNGKGATLSQRGYLKGGSNGRVGYALAGVPGVAVFDLGMFDTATLASGNGLPPATFTVDAPMAAPRTRKGDNVTSAVIAGSNTAATAAAKADSIAEPATVAAVAATAGKAIVDAVAGKGSVERMANAASTAAKAVAHGKGHNVKRA